VDDDTITNYVNKSLLEDLEVSNSIDISYNGQDALNYLEAQNKVGNVPDLLLLDIYMPNMNAFEFLDAYKSSSSLTKKTSVVILTSSTVEQDHEMAKSYNVAGYLLKPLTREKLEQILHMI